MDKGMLASSRCGISVKVCAAAKSAHQSKPRAGVICVNGCSAAWSPPLRITGALRLASSCRSIPPTPTPFSTCAFSSTFVLPSPRLPVLFIASAVRRLRALRLFARAASSSACAMRMCCNCLVALIGIRFIGSSRAAGISIYLTGAPIASSFFLAFQRFRSKHLAAFP